jgi:ATP-dependent Lon protease
MLQPLLDRIEIIQIPAYLPIEKLQIAERYLIPRFEKEYGFLNSEDNSQADSSKEEASAVF